jgi:hypothetical protein
MQKFVLLKYKSPAYYTILTVQPIVGIVIKPKTIFYPMEIQMKLKTSNSFFPGLNTNYHRKIHFSNLKFILAK